MVFVRLRGSSGLSLFFFDGLSDARGSIKKATSANRLPGLRETTQNMYNNNIIKHGLSL